MGINLFHKISSRNAQIGNHDHDHRLMVGLWLVGVMTWDPLLRRAKRHQLEKKAKGEGGDQEGQNDDPHGGSKKT